MSKSIAAEPRHPLGLKLVRIFGAHPWQSIQADNAAPNQKVSWRTNSYPVWPRILWQSWQDPSTVIGVRFGSQTTYGLLDIDADSPYCHPEAIAQIRSALETIGIVRTLLLRSSHSNGLHLYLPLPEPVRTFGLAVGLQQCLQAHGFSIAPGQLEIFPNVKTYGVEIFVQYNGHRLPLQPATGSCLLNEDFNPIGSGLEQFLSTWEGIAAGQDLTLLREAITQAREARKQLSRRRCALTKIQVWQADMEQEMREGWSGPGQTNHLLKVIGCYGHVILQLSSHDLERHIYETAQRLPGYQQHCDHQTTLHQRAKDWAVSIQKLYWPAGTHPNRPQTVQTLNEQRAISARERITQAVQHLRSSGRVPQTISRWAQQIAKVAHCSLQTLYKHCPLWHPNHIQGAEPARGGVKDAIEGHATAFNPQTSAPSNPFNPCKTKGLHTEGAYMRCEGGETAVPQSKTPERGVRGGKCSFPQPTATSSPIPFDEVHPLIQAQVQALNWSLPDMRRFLFTHFQGRSHLWDLQAHELTTCLYHLQTQVLSLASR